MRGTVDSHRGRNEVAGAGSRFDILLPIGASHGGEREKGASPLRLSAASAP